MSEHSGVQGESSGWSVVNSMRTRAKRKKRLIALKIVTWIILRIK